MTTSEQHLCHSAGTVSYTHNFSQTVAELGVVIFTALDFGLKEEEERQLSPALEHLIDRMTSIGEGGGGKGWGRKRG